MMVKPAATRRLRILAIGVRPEVVAAIMRRGHTIDRHALDLGPAAALAGQAWTPPVVAWPGESASYDRVFLWDELARVVDDEAAIAEAARVLRPGGVLTLRVPGAGVLAWLDPYNAYRYLRDATRRGTDPVETRGLGWQRHYRQADIDDLLRPHFSPPAMRRRGVGLAAAFRLALAILFRWLVPREARYQRGQPLARRLETLDDLIPGGPLGTNLIMTARRREDDRAHKAQ